MTFSATHRHKIWRDLWSRKARTLLVAASIFVGVLGVVTLTSVGELMIAQLRDDLQESEISMLSVFVNTTDDSAADSITHTQTLDTLRQYDGVTTVEALSWERIFWKTPDEDSFLESTLLAYADPYETLTIEPMAVIDGGFPVADNNELALERRMAERFDLNVGDELTIRIIGQLDSDTADVNVIPEETWTISGIVFHPYSFIGSESVYVTAQDSQYITGSHDLALIQTRFVDFNTADSQADDFEAWLENNTVYESQGYSLNDPANNELITEVGQWVNVLSALAVIAMLVASFLVVTVVSNILVEQKRQIGVMKSIGASRGDNYAIYTSLALAYGVIGTVPGVMLGVPAGYLLAKTTAPLAGAYIEGFVISPVGVLVGVVMGLGVPVIASSLPVYRGTGVSILAAITDFGISSDYGRGLWARVIRRLPVPPSVKQGLANLSQKKGRLLLTGLTLTLAVGAFMGVSAVFLSIGNAIDTAFETYNTEILIQPDAIQDFNTLSAIIVENNDAVEEVNAVYDAGVRVLNVAPETIDLNDNQAVNDHSEFLFITGFDPAGDVIRLDLLSGEGWQNDLNRDGIVLTETDADLLGKTTGDTLMIVHDGSVHEINVIGIDAFPFDGAFMRWDALAAIFETPDNIVPDEFWLQLHDNTVTAGDTDLLIADLRELLLANGITADFHNQIADEEENNQTILTIGLIFNIASAVMAAIGAIGLLVSMSITIFERQREIGVMRSIGAGTTTIVGQFLTEGLLVGVVAWMIGVPLSIGIGVGMNSVLPIDNEFNYPPLSLILGFVGMLLIAFVASIWPSVAASRKTVSDILRYQ